MTDEKEAVKSLYRSIETLLIKLEKEGLDNCTEYDRGMTALRQYLETKKRQRKTLKNRIKELKS